MDSLKGEGYEAGDSVSALERLLADDALRCRIAGEGHRFIQRFTWERSYELLKTTLGL